jgi:hypothetical protein
VTLTARTIIVGGASAMLVASLWALLPFTTAPATRVVLALDAAVALLLALVAGKLGLGGPDGARGGAVACASPRRIELGVRVVDPRVAHVLSVRRAARIRHSELVA